VVDEWPLLGRYPPPPHAAFADALKTSALKNRMKRLAEDRMAISPVRLNLNTAELGSTPDAKCRIGD
jgi:hypothetical protein